MDILVSAEGHDNEDGEYDDDDGDLEDEGGDGLLLHRLFARADELALGRRTREAQVTRALSCRDPAREFLLGSVQVEDGALPIRRRLLPPTDGKVER